MIKKILLFTAAVLCFSQLAFADSKAKAKKAAVEAPPPEENYTVPVQQTAVHIDASDVKYSPLVADWELSGSNWVPNHLSRPSLIPADDHFSNGSVPMIGISRVNSLATAPKGLIETVIGFEYAKLSRSGSLSSSGNPVGTQENLNLAAIKLGADYRFLGFSSQVFQPALEVALMPTWLSSETSSFEQYGVSALRVVFQAELKLMYCPAFLQSSRFGQQSTGEGLGLALLATSGTVGGSDLAGSGLQGIFRFAF